MDYASKNKPMLTMPSSEELAVATIQRLSAEGYTSSVMKLTRPLLNELGRRLVEPGASNSQVIEWLRALKDIANSDLPDRNIQRFAQRFREVYKAVWSDHANQLLVAELSADPDFDLESLQGLIKNRVTTMIAQEVISTAPADLKTDRLNAALTMIISADKGKHEAAKLALATKQAEDRATKLEADIERIKADMQLKQTRIDERVKALQSQLDKLASRAERGESIDPSLFAKIREELTGVAA